MNERNISGRFKMVNLEYRLNCIDELIEDLRRSFIALREEILELKKELKEVMK